MSPFEVNQIIILIIIITIGIVLIRIRVMHEISGGLFFLCMSVVLHGVAFGSLVIFRHAVLDIHEPSVNMTYWSSIWRVHALVTVLGVLYGIMNPGIKSDE